MHFRLYSCRQDNKKQTQKDCLCCVLIYTSETNYTQSSDTPQATATKEDNLVLLYFESVLLLKRLR